MYKVFFVNLRILFFKIKCVVCILLFFGIVKSFILLSSQFETQLMRLIFLYYLNINARHESI
jgi:hypothetical protein